jgi:8-oxo-dGTP pyrophosphatase MutT (NUDIX family)
MPSDSASEHEMNANLPAELRSRLAARQPEPDVLERFAPSHTRGLRFEPPPIDARPASVIVLLYPRDGAWCFPLVVRPNHLRHHQGQVALPGGAQEPGEPLVATALRELGEELGIVTDHVDVLGPLTPFFVPASRFQVHPWIGWLAAPPPIQANPHEVETVLELQLGTLLGTSALATEERELSGQRVEVPYFAAGPHKVWGATCIVLGELATVCDDLGL